MTTLNNMEAMYICILDKYLSRFATKIVTISEPKSLRISKQFQNRNSYNSITRLYMSAKTPRLQ